MNNPKIVTDWLPAKNGAIRGMIGERGITTSRVVSRDGFLVTTESGSVYQLDSTKPHPYVDDQGCRDDFYGGAKSLEEALDWTIAEASR